jgi:hypothetical protein
MWLTRLLNQINHTKKFAPLDSTAIYPKPGHALLYTTFDRWNEMPYKYIFALRIPFYLLQCRCNTCTNQSQMIWSIPYHHVTILVHQSWLRLLFTVASAHRCQVITQLALHTCNRFIEPSLVLIFSTLVTWLNVMSHMQWAPLSHVWALQHIQAISPLWHVLLTHIYLWTNHLCISLKHIFVHLRLSLNYQNQTRTFQSHPFW